MEDINVVQNMYTLFDSKADAYHFPFVARNDEVAIRMIISRAMDPNHDLYRFGADYTLFRMGRFHDRNGHIEMFDAFKNLGTALQLSVEAGVEYNDGE